MQEVKKYKIHSMKNDIQNEDSSLEYQMTGTCEVIKLSHVSQNETLINGQFFPSLIWIPESSCI
jgi:hypothetical protein